MKVDDTKGFELLKPIEGGLGGCMCCGYQHEILPMEAIIAVGFGHASLTKNGETVYDEQNAESEDDYLLVSEAEKTAAAEPLNDWRINLVAPLSERHYQRQGDKHWVLYEKGPGFA